MLQGLLLDTRRAEEVKRDTGPGILGSAEGRAEKGREKNLSQFRITDCGGTGWEKGP